MFFIVKAVSIHYEGFLDKLYTLLCGDLWIVV